MFRSSDNVLEFHVHTSKSKDSILAPAFACMMLRIKGIRNVCVTNHNSLISSKDATVFKRFGLNIIPGEEIMTQKGEVIGLFLNEHIPCYMSLADTIEEIKRQNGIVCIPHTVDKKREKTVIEKSEIINHVMSIDMVEYFNARTVSPDDLIKQNQLYIELQKINPNIVGIIGSDAHSIFELGRNNMHVNKKVLTRDNFLESVRCATGETKRSIAISHYWTKFVKLIKFVKNVEKMQYLNMTLSEVEKLTYVFSKKIRRDFEPDLIVFIAKGGFIVGRTIAEYMNAPLYEVETERNGSIIKSFFSPIIRLLPNRIRFWIIELEMRLHIHNNTKRKIMNVANDLINLSKHIGKCNILLVDDAVDTGSSMNAAKESIMNLFPQATIKSASISVIDYSKDFFETDYHIFDNTIIKTGTSKDSSEHKDFLKEYYEWKNNPNRYEKKCVD